MIYRALDLAFSLHADEPEVQVALERLYADCVSERRCQTSFSIRGRDNDYAVRVDDATVRTTPHRTLALAHLVWEVNRHGVDHCTRSLVLHAGAVERERRAVLVSGVSGAGKSTLVASLIARGFAYLTDEAVAVHPTTRNALPYPKPIALSTDSCTLFPGVDATDAGTERFVTAADLGGTAGVGSLPRVVLFPSYRPGSVTALERMTRADALVMLSQQSFNATGLGQLAFDTLVEMLRGCECYRIEHGDAHRAAEAVSGLFG